MNNGGKFNETLKIIFAHPVASFFLLDAGLSGIANIIRAIKSDGGNKMSVEDAKELFDQKLESNPIE